MSLLFTIVLIPVVGLVPPAAAIQDAGIPVNIETIPHVEGVSFMFEGERVVSDEEGIARTRVALPGTYSLRVPRFQVLDENVRVEFSQWSRGGDKPRLEVTVGGETRIQAGFDVDYLVTTRFTDARGGDLQAGVVESVTVVDDSGAVTTYPGEEPGLAGPTAVWWERHPPGTRWLRGSRAVSSGGSLDSEPVSYRADNVVVEGRRVSTSSALSYPARQQEWNIEVMAYPVRFDPRGLVSRFGVSSNVQLTQADGESRSYRVEADRVALLPRGSYEARADVLGVPLSTDFTVPGSDEVRILAITYVDVVTAALLIGLVVFVATRARTRHRQRGARPAPAPARVRPEPRERPTAGAAVAEESAREDIRVERSYVRAYMNDGRSVEGWSRRWRESQIWFMDVAIVRNGEGAEIPSTSRDTVLLSSDIERVERLEAVPPFPDSA